MAKATRDAIRTDIADDAAIAALPTGARSKEYYVGNGLYVVVLRTGRRKFVAYGRNVTPEGWVKSKARLIGYWPAVNLESAKAYAATYRNKSARSGKLPTVRGSAAHNYTPVLLQDILRVPWEN